MNRTDAGRGRKLAWSIRLAGGVLVLGGLLAPCLAGSGYCVSADIDQPMRLPGGALQPAGRLTLCEGRLSPVMNIHRTYLDGHPVAMLISHTQTAEGRGGERPVFYFVRGENGRLELIGYVLPTRESSVTYRFDQNRSPSRQPVLEAASWTEDRLIALAAGSN